MFTIGNFSKETSEKGTEYIKFDFYKPRPDLGATVYEGGEVGIAIDQIKELKKLLDSVIDKGENKDE